jgi:hypothetical protein
MNLQKFHLLISHTFSTLKSASAWIFIDFLKDKLVQFQFKKMLRCFKIEDFSLLISSAKSCHIDNRLNIQFDIHFIIKRN